VLPTERTEPGIPGARGGPAADDAVEQSDRGGARDQERVLAALFGTHEARLLRVIERRLGGLRYHVEPRDILQEAALVIVQRKERIRAENDGQWLALILAIATNLIRSKARRPNLLQERTSLVVGDGKAEPQSASGESDGAGRRAGAIATSFSGGGTKRQPAPAEGRLALLLRDDLDLDWPRIAFILGRGVDAARMIRLREVRRLASHLGNETNYPRPAQGSPG
jgi:DNA-directed RNA polymerase specialized sigma24 family protein